MSRTDGPVFIVGSPRSGTTVLGEALAQHPALWATGELHILTRLYGGGRLEAVLAKEFEFPGALRREGISREEFLVHLGEGIATLMRERGGGRRWVEQTPGHVHMIGTLIDMFPRSKFLHMLRDGRAVLHSMMNFGNSQSPDVQDAVRTAGYFPTWASDFRNACETWSRSVEAGMRAAERWPRQVRTFRYERLDRDPEGFFGELLPFIEAAFDDRPAAYVRSTRVSSSFSSSATRLEGADAQLTWTDEQRATFAEIAEPIMRLWVPDYGSRTRPHSHSRDAMG